MKYLYRFSVGFLSLFLALTLVFNSGVSPSYMAPKSLMAVPFPSDSILMKLSRSEEYFLKLHIQSFLGDRSRITKREFLDLLIKDLDLSFDTAQQRTLLERFQEGEWQPLLLAIYLKRTSRTDRAIQIITQQMVLKNDTELAFQAFDFLTHVDYSVAITVFETILKMPRLSPLIKERAFQSAVTLTKRYVPKKEETSAQEGVVDPYLKAVKLFSQSETAFPHSFQEQVDWLRHRLVLKDEQARKNTLFEKINSLDYENETPLRARLSKAFFRSEVLISFGATEEALSLLKSEPWETADTIKKRGTIFSYRNETILFSKKAQLLYRLNLTEEANQLLESAVEFLVEDVINKSPSEFPLVLFLETIKAVKDEAVRRHILEKFESISLYGKRSRHFRKRTRIAQAYWIGGFHEESIRWFNQSIKEFSDSSFTRGDRGEEFKAYFDLLISLPFQTEQEKEKIINLMETFLNSLGKTVQVSDRHDREIYSLTFECAKKMHQFAPEERTKVLAAISPILNGDRFYVGEDVKKGLLEFLLELKETDLIVQYLVQSDGWDNQFVAPRLVELLSLVIEAFDQEQIDQILVLAPHLQTETFLFANSQYLPSLAVRLSVGNDFQEQFEAQLNQIGDEESPVYVKWSEYIHYIHYLNKIGEKQKSEAQLLDFISFIDVYFTTEIRGWNRDRDYPYALDQLLGLFKVLDAVQVEKFRELISNKLSNHLPEWRIFEFNVNVFRSVADMKPFFKVYQKIAQSALDSEDADFIDKTIWLNYLTGLFRFKEEPEFISYFTEIFNVIMDKTTSVSAKESYVFSVLPFLKELSHPQSFSIVMLILNQEDLLRNVKMREELSSVMSEWVSLYSKEGTVSYAPLFQFGQTPVDLQRHFFFTDVDQAKVVFPEESLLFEQWVKKVCAIAGLKSDRFLSSQRIEGAVLSEQNKTTFLSGAVQVLPEFFYDKGLNFVRQPLFFISDLIAQHSELQEQLVDLVVRYWVDPYLGYIEESLLNDKDFEISGLTEMVVKLLVALEEHSPQLDLVEPFYQRIEQFDLSSNAKQKWKYLLLKLIRQEYLFLIHDLDEVGQVEKLAYFQQKLDWIASLLDSKVFLPRVDAVEVSL